MHNWTCIRHPQASFPLSAYRIAVTARAICQVSYCNNGLRITFLKLFDYSRVIAACFILHNIAIDRCQANDDQCEDEEEMQLSIVDHVTEENVLALRRKGFEKRDNITRNYFTWNTHISQFDMLLLSKIETKIHIWKKKTDSGINLNCLLTAWLYGIYNFRHFFPHLLFRQRETNFLSQFEKNRLTVWLVAIYR